MTTDKTLQFTVERTIPAPATEVFDAWLDRNTPGTPWHEAEQCILDPTVDGLFYSRLGKTAHYGRFMVVERARRIVHTWVSPNTLGVESTVTVTFESRGDDTLMTLVHTGLPDHEKAHGHDKGWNHFLGLFCERFGQGASADSGRKKATTANA